MSPWARRASVVEAPARFSRVESVTPIFPSAGDRGFAVAEAWVWEGDASGLHSRAGCFQATRPWLITLPL